MTRPRTSWIGKVTRPPNTIVESTLGFSLGDQPGLNADRRRNAPIAQSIRDRIPACRRVADPKLLGRITVEAPRDQITSRGFGVFSSKGFSIELLGGGVGFEDLRDQARIRAIALFGNLDPELTREVARSLGKAEAFVLHHKGDDIAAGLAAETMEHFAIRADVKGRGLLVVKGTEPFPIAARLSKFDIA